MQASMFGGMFVAAWQERTIGRVSGGQGRCVHTCKKGHRAAGGAGLRRDGTYVSTGCSCPRCGLAAPPGAAWKEARHVTTDTSAIIRRSGRGPAERLGGVSQSRRLGCSREPARHLPDDVLSLPGRRRAVRGVTDPLRLSGRARESPARGQPDNQGGRCYLQSDPARSDPRPPGVSHRGPGGAIVVSWGASIVATGLHMDFVGNRDLILVDQRGTGLSQPQLACPEISRAGWQALDRHLSDPATVHLEYGALRACRARLVKAGIDLSAYNTVENAADIAALRTALGYKEVDLYGGSYGSTLALQVMRDHPQGIRSVVMDAVADPLFDVYNDFIPSTWNALQRVFKECAAVPSCNTAHPHLRQTFMRAVARLQAH